MISRVYDNAAGDDTIRLGHVHPTGFFDMSVLRFLSKIFGLSTKSHETLIREENPFSELGPVASSFIAHRRPAAGGDPLFDPLAPAICV